VRQARSYYMSCFSGPPNKVGENVPGCSVVVVPSRMRGYPASGERLLRWPRCSCSRQDQYDWRQDRVTAPTGQWDRRGAYTRACCKPGSCHRWTSDDQVATLRRTRLWCNFAKAKLGGDLPLRGLRAPVNHVCLAEDPVVLGLGQRRSR
jgi:hypothetical protein